MAAVINEININSASHVITVEDPIEFVHENKKSIIEQREVKSHTKSFPNALKAVLREDPDVVYIGEMRDLETISLAITAAETGQLVLATLHTSGAAKSVDRIIDAFPFEQQNQIRAQLSESLRTVIWQNLLKTKDGKGRIAALEIMFSNNAIANMIRKSKTHQIDSAIETGFKEGMQTMKKSVTDLLEADLISEEEAIANLPQEFEA
jgi:twitching motility protein PilT